MRLRRTWGDAVRTVRPASASGCSPELCLRRTPAQPTSPPIAGGRAGSVSTQATAPVAHARRIAVNAYGTVFCAFAPFRESERRAHERSRRLLCSFEAPDTRQTPSLCRTHLETVSGLVRSPKSVTRVSTQSRRRQVGVLRFFRRVGTKLLYLVQGPFLGTTHPSRASPTPHGPPGADEDTAISPQRRDPLRLSLIHI